jgi:hypothetical protein
MHEFAIEKPRHGLQSHVRMMRANVHGRGIRERQRAEPVEKAPWANEALPLHRQHPVTVNAPRAMSRPGNDSN